MNVVKDGNDNFYIRTDGYHKDKMKHQQGGGGVLVWGCIHSSGLTLLRKSMDILILKNIELCWKKIF